MIRLQSALAGISGVNFSGLENVLGQFLLPARLPAYAPAEIATIVAHLKTYWFDPTSPARYFPGFDVAGIYGVGMLKTIEESLKHNLPVDAWWALDHAVIDMLNFVTPRQVTLVIATPRPARSIEARLAGGAEPTAGFSTRQSGGTVETRKLEIPGRR